MTQRAAIYARVSSDDQRSNSSIPTQVRECLRHIENKGYSLVGDHFVDPETGQDVDTQAGNVAAFVDDYTSRELSRPGLDPALVFLETVGFDVLIVHSLDRLARDPYIRQTLEIELRQRGASVEFVLGNYEQSPEGEVRKDLDATFAKWENLKRVERSLRGKRWKAKRGLFVSGRPPYGYELDKTAQAGLAVIESEAEIIRKIYELYGRTGFSIRAITENLTGEGIPSPTGLQKWGRSTVSKILKNETYAGTNYYNKHKREGKRLVKRPREEWIKIETTSIVGSVLFGEVQDKLDRNRATRRRQPHRFYMLTGMVYCADCGRPYSTQTQLAGSNRRKNDAPSYRHRTKEGHCRNRTISARKVDPIVWARMVEVLLDPSNLHKGYEESLEHQRSTIDRQQSRLETLENNRRKLGEKETNLMMAYLDPEIQMTKMEYIEHRATIDNEIKILDERIQSIANHISELDFLPEIESVNEFAHDVRDKLTEDVKLSPEEKRRILDVLHVRVFIPEQGDLWIDGWFEKGSEWQTSTTLRRYELEKNTNQQHIHLSRPPRNGAAGDFFHTVFDRSPEYDIPLRLPSNPRSAPARDCVKTPA